MKPSRSLGQLATVLITLAPLASAWPSWLPALDALVVRQDSSGSSSSKTPTETGKPTPTKSGSDADNTHNLNTGGLTTDADGATITAPPTSNSTNTKGGNHTMFDPQSPAGGVVMITPALTAGSQLYKIGDYVTWKWNYTNLLATPTAIDVLASCSLNSGTYTLTQNMTFQTQGAYTWDTNAYQQSAKASPLLSEEYTLIIYDADSSISATAEPGYLGTFNQFRFGLYTPQPYTPLASGWVCASCSGAVSAMDKRAIGFALTMCAVTVASFTWFVTGLGVAL